MALSRRRFVGAAGATLLTVPAAAEPHADTLRYVTGGAVNTLDPVMAGATVEATSLGTCLYDRLLRPGPPGTLAVEPELTETWEVSDGGRTVTFRLRPGARWHDGSPVTAADVQWSFTRALQPRFASSAQLATGSLVHPEQMQVLDDRSLQLALPRPDRLALPNLASFYCPILNSRLARQHATEDDPWAAAWLKTDTAGGGAYHVSAVTPGQSVVLERNDAWANGPRPAFRRVLLRTVPEPATRAALLARGDADITTALPPPDLRALGRDPALRVFSTPLPTGFAALVFGTAHPPFDRPEVRRALSFAVPYQAIFDVAADRRGAPLFGAAWAAQPPVPAFPQPMPFRTDLPEARRRLAAAGLSAGWDTTLSYGASRAALADPAAALVAESFAAVGVRVRIEKLPDSQMAERTLARTLPLLLDRSLALFPSTEYFFRIFLSGPGRWNFSGWSDPVVDGLLPRARAATNPAEAEALDRQLVARFADQVPMALLFQPSQDVVTAGAVAGVRPWTNALPDFRDLFRS